jgi:hypothetical protein
MNRPKSVQAHILREYKLDGWEEKITGRWTYRDISEDPVWFRGWISFDSVTWNPNDKKLYCGLNSLDGDLLYKFDPKSQQFECLKTQQWADRFDVKIHRTLLLNPRDQCFYFATSLLHDLDQQREAKGGKLLKFNPRTCDYQVIGVPVSHLYIQSIAADWEREILYGFTYPSEALFKTNLRTGTSKILAHIGNAIMFVQPHNAVVDKQGWLWGTYAETRAWDETLGRQPVRIFKYHPDQDKFCWLEYGLSRRDNKEQLIEDPPKPKVSASTLSETRHKEDFGFCDSMAYDGDRYIYAGTVAGVLSRIDTQTCRVEKIAHVMAAGRFPALTVKEGVLYGAGGVRGYTQLIRWDTHTSRIEGYTDLVDDKLNDRPARIHELAVDDEHRIYLGENDNHKRSSFLWTVRLD